MTAPTFTPPREVLPWDAPKETWLKARVQSVTATDIAAICGVHPYRSAFETWAEMTGDPFPDTAGEAAEIGLALEPVVADLWEKRPEGKPLARVGLVAHPERDWMRCTPDRLALRERVALHSWSDVIGVVELKTALGWAHLNWTEDTAPDVAQFQVAWQLAVTGLDRAWLVALAGPSLKTYEIERDQTFIDDLTEIAERFLRENVEKRIPPAPDGTDRLADLLSKRWSPDPDKVVVLDPKEFRPLDLARKQAAEDRKAAEARETAAKNGIRLLLQDAEQAVIDGEPVANWRTVERKGFTVAPSTYRSLTFPKGKK